VGVKIRFEPNVGNGAQLIPGNAGGVNDHGEAPLSTVNKALINLSLSGVGSKDKPEN
jgi:hypothetical protein